MGGPRRPEDQPPKPADDAPAPPAPIPLDDDLFEDGDIATPKRDHDPENDGPL